VGNTERPHLYTRPDEVPGVEPVELTVWLLESDVRASAPDMVAGTSIGAVNGALVIVGKPLADQPIIKA
jgi:hypothetical protein